MYRFQPLVTAASRCCRSKKTPTFVVVDCVWPDAWRRCPRRLAGAELDAIARRRPETLLARLSRKNRPVVEIGCRLSGLNVELSRRSLRKIERLSQARFSVECCSQCARTNEPPMSVSFAAEDLNFGSGNRYGSSGRRKLVFDDGRERHTRSRCAVPEIIPPRRPVRRSRH